MHYDGQTWKQDEKHANQKKLQLAPALRVTFSVFLYFFSGSFWQKILLVIILDILYSSQKTYMKKREPDQWKAILTYYKIFFIVKIIFSYMTFPIVNLPRSYILQLHQLSTKKKRRGYEKF